MTSTDSTSESIAWGMCLLRGSSVVSLEEEEEKEEEEDEEEKQEEHVERFTKQKDPIGSSAPFRIGCSAATWHLLSELRHRECAILLGAT